MWKGYLSHRWPAKAQASLHSHAVPSEPSLFAPPNIGNYRKLHKKSQTYGSTCWWLCMHSRRITNRITEGSLFSWRLNLTHFYLASLRRDLGKECRPRSGSTMFAYRNFKWNRTSCPMGNDCSRMLACTCTHLFPRKYNPYLSYLYLSCCCRSRRKFQLVSAPEQHGKSY